MISEIASVLFHKDAGAYGEEYQNFLRELRSFHDTRGTSFNKVPRIHGREIDLYMLYTLVSTSGGWEKVTAKDEWGTLLPYFGIPRACSNGDIALKQVYVRYLDVYERIHFLGEEVDRREADLHEEDDSRNKRRNLRLLHALPLSYNYQQHQVTSSVREYAGLSTELAQLSVYERVLLSLLSPLPNEQDFAVNVCTLLGGDGKQKLLLKQCPKLVDVLLAHAGVFASVDLRTLLVETYRQSRQQNLEQFWRDVVPDPQIRDLVYRDMVQEMDKEELVCIESEETSFLANSGRATPDSVLDIELAPPPARVPPAKKPTLPWRPSLVSSVGLDGTFVPEVERLAEKASEGLSHLQLETSDSELFNLNRDLGVKDVLGQRVLQIAMLIRNLSFEEGNVSMLAKNPTVLRFLLLGLHGQWNSLSQLALDALANLAIEITLREPVDCSVSAIFLDSLTRGLQSFDRFWVLGCIEVVTKLCQKEENENILSTTLDQSVYECLCRFLTVPDIMLLIYTLECLYAVSDLGETACNNILRCQGALDILVSMLTVEAQSFGSKACILMRVVETAGESDSVPVNVTVAATTATATPVAITTAQTFVVNSSNAAVLVKSPVITTSAAKVINRTATPSVTSRTQVKVTPTVSKVTTPLVITPSSSAPAYLPAEKEKAAISWLKSMFEMSLGAPSLEQGALYRLYSTAMTNAGNKLILATASFYSSVKLAFGSSVGPFRKQVGQVVEFHYESLKPKAAASTGTQQQDTPSILQAHLSSPPKTLKKEQDKSFLTTPTSAPDKVSTNSSLIKSLLANKVNESIAAPLFLRPNQGSACANNISMDLNVLPASEQQHVASQVTPQVVKRQQQQKLQPVLTEGQSSSNKVGDVNKLDEADVKTNEGGKGLLANLLEKEIPRNDTVNGGLSTGRELRISDKGLELVINASNEGSSQQQHSSSVDGRVIAQVDDAGHVQIHLEESSEPLSNGQMLLDALEQNEANVIPAATNKRKREETNLHDKTGAKKPKQESILERAMEFAKIEEEEQQPTPPPSMGQVVLVGNQVSNSSGASAVGLESQQQDTKMFFVANQTSSNKAFLILQPQGSRLMLSPHNQKMLLALRPQNQNQTSLSDSSEGIVTFSGGAVAIPAKNIPKPPIPVTARAVTPVSTSAASAPVGENSTSSVTITPVIPPLRKLATDREELAYLCEWRGCGKSWKSPTELYLHACQVHCPLTFEEGLCEWEKCDTLKRRRFSLMTHLQDRHCNEEVQRVLALRRQQLSALGKTDIQPLPIPPPHPGYAPHAALQAIKRHALEYMNQKDTPEEKEGPVTKSIRLTAALILRNLVIYSSLGRRCLRRYEPLLCAIALSPVESARTVSQLLYDMANPNTNTSSSP